MPQIINTNIASLNAQRNLNKSQSANQTSLQRLSSGLRINSAKDDAAGLAISTRFNSQIRGLNVAVRNAGDGISLAQTAEGALGSMNDNLQRVRELAVQSANATNSDVDREALQAEVSQLLAEVSRTAEDTDFNGRKLLDGSFNATFQIGANAGQTLDVSIGELTADKLGASDSVGISSQGSNSGLQNGDLIINGEAIAPSQASDDTSSFDNAEASAIAKSAAINKSYDETGVKAVVNENTLTGSEMTAPAATNTGTLTLNGVDIEISQTTDAAQTRAAAVAAINAVSDQTGVSAIDSETDAGGVNLVAADGRNITVDFDATLTTAASGISGTDGGASFTSEGGYTLVADGDVSEVVIKGGDGTGNGDLANAGLSLGTYSTTQAQLTTTAVTKATAVDLSSSFSGATGVPALGQDLAFASAGMLGTAGAFGMATGGEIITVTAGSQTTTISASAGTIVGAVTVANGGFGADKLAAALDGMDGVEASAETKVQISGLVVATTGSTSSFNVYGAGTTEGTLLGSYSITSSSTLATIAAEINTEGGTIVAEYVSSGTERIELTQTDGQTIQILMVNSSAGIAASVSTATISENGTVAVAAAATTVGRISVGYISETNITDESITSISMSSNKAAAGLDGYSSGLVSAVFSDVAYGSGGTATANGSSVSATVTPSITGLTDGDLVLNGVAIQGADAGSDTASAITASDGSNIQTSTKLGSAIATADAINAVSEETGVTARVNETRLVGSDASTVTTTDYAAGDSGKLYVNGIDLGILSLADDGSGAIDNEASRATAIDLINSKAGQTGVMAEDNGESITLVAADGRNISIAIDNDEVNNTGTGTTFGAQFGLDAAIDGIGEADIGIATVLDTTGTRGSKSEGATYETTYGTVTLESAKQINVSVGSDGKDELEAMGLTGGSFGGGENGQFLTEIDVSTFEGATAALTAIDNAIGSIASQRADLGALQNRMESTVSNLAITSENLSAANSRIQDADFAAETAELSRTQVLQQAGISILSQANQGPQQVLSLLG
jgi:flagellin